VSQRREIVEEFTFRSGELAVTTQAVIDTGASTTQITLGIAAALRLEAPGKVTIRLADGSHGIAFLYKCVVAWTIYEHQGYHSHQEVVCSPGETPLIGFDFLQRHQLAVDTYHMGLVGTAPPTAVPLSGGGYVLNPPKGWVRERNYLRAQAAKPGEILRPHPYWRFRLPAIQKRSSE
jgi:predicted aspartyl protease